MKHYYELDESDIAQALADHYNCDKKMSSLQSREFPSGMDPESIWSLVSWRRLPRMTVKSRNKNRPYCRY